MLGRTEEGTESYNRAAYLRSPLTSASSDAEGIGSESLLLDSPTNPLGISDATTWVNRGQANLKANQASTALTDFDNALQLDNTVVDAWVGRGDALRLLGRTSEGDACYDQAATLRAGLDVLPLMDLVVVVDTSAPLQTQIQEMQQGVDEAIATVSTERSTNIQITWLGTQSAWDGTPIDQSVMAYLARSTPQTALTVAGISQSAALNEHSSAQMLTAVMTQFPWRPGAAQSLLFMGHTALTRAQEDGNGSGFDRLVNTAKQTGTTVSTYLIPDSRLDPRTPPPESPQRAACGQPDGYCH